MKWENTFVGCVGAIIKYKFLKLRYTNIKCWLGHDYKDTNDPNIKMCRKCGQKTLFINAIYEE